VLAVPQGVSDDDLWEGAKFRSRGRLPVLTFLHRGTGASITRGAQPLPGLLSFRSRADEAALAAIRQANPRGGERPLVIVDCRSRLSALANSAKGAGTESPQNYGGCRVEHLGVGNIHAMRQALRAVFLSCSRPSPGSFAGWLPWMGHLELLLSAASQVAQLVGRWGTSVFVHCSDGWDRTAQLVGLAQVLAEPFFRSLEGFAVLVEKDWAGFGHKFADRCGHGQPGGFWDEHERSPIFLQWLDCLHQLLLQFPQAFEYNEQFLCAVMDHVYSCSFGTFLFNSPLEREQAGVRQSCPSLWSWTDLPAQRRRFVNPLYSPAPGLLLPDCSPQRLKPWGGYFCRWRGALQLRLPEDALLGRVRELTEQQAGLQESLGCLSRRLHSALGELREAQRGQTALRQTARLVVREDPAGGPPRYVAELPLPVGQGKGEDAGGEGEELGGGLGIIEDYEDPALQEEEGGGWVNLRPRPLEARGSWAELLGVDLAKLGGLASAVVSSVWATAASLPFPALVQPPPSHPLEAEEVEEDEEEGRETEEFEMYPELPQ
jgi:hypothetical protein